MSSGLMFDDIIMNILRNKKLKLHGEEDGCFKKILIKTFIFTGGHFKNFTGRKAHASV